MSEPERFYVTKCNARSPHVHRHCFLCDEDVKRLGFIVLELCCHGCGQSVWLFYDWPVPEKSNQEELALKLLENFEGRHKHCFVNGPPELIASRCPPIRTFQSYVDLRGLTLDRRP